jgi:hypothetical protein
VTILFLLNRYRDRHDSDKLVSQRKSNFWVSIRLRAEIISLNPSRFALSVICPAAVLLLCLNDSPSFYFINVVPTVIMKPMAYYIHNKRICGTTTYYLALERI